MRETLNLYRPFNRDGDRHLGFAYEAHLSNERRRLYAGEAPAAGVNLLVESTVPEM